MRQPVFWMSVGVAFGAWSWPWWEPELLPLLMVAVSVCLYLIFHPTCRTSDSCLIFVAVLLGAAAPASIPDPIPLPPRATVQAKVVSTMGWRAIAETSDNGRLLLSFSGRAPAPGVEIAALTTPMTPPVRLPGDMGTDRDWRRGRLQSRRVRRWVALGGQRQGGHRPPAFDDIDNGALLWALASGDRSGLDKEVVDLLRRTGTAHLLAISGLHIGMVAGFMWWVGWLISRPMVWLSSVWPSRVIPALSSVLGAIWYSNLVGWPVSTRRATTMVVCFAISRCLGRRVSTLHVLGLAGCVVVLRDPYQVTSPAFLMSFGAVLGIVSWASWATRRVPGPAPVRWLFGSVAATSGATFGTLPINAWLFQQLSILSPLCNLIAGPLIAGVGVPMALLSVRLDGRLQSLTLTVADLVLGLALRGLTVFDVSPIHPAVGPIGA